MSNAACLNDFRSVLNHFMVLKISNSFPFLIILCVCAFVYVTKDKTQIPVFCKCAQLVNYILSHSTTLNLFFFNGFPIIFTLEKYFHFNPGVIFKIQ